MDRPKIEDYFTNEKFKFANKFGYNITFDSGLYEQALNSYIDQLEKALDKACKELSSHTVECDLVQCPINCEYDSCDFDCGNTQKWKEWCMRDEE